MGVHTLQESGTSFTFGANGRLSPNGNAVLTINQSRLAVSLQGLELVAMTPNGKHFVFETP